MQLTNLTSLAVPLIMAVIMLVGLIRKVDVFSVFCEGAAEGLRTCADILPALVLLMVCIGMLEASGAVEALTRLLTPLCSAVGFPAECMPMVLLRPFSGSGAIAVYNDIAASNGADSFAGRVASVLLGSSETTFYTVAVYFSAVKVRKTRYAVPAALTSDLTSWLVCGIVVMLFFGA